MKVSIITVCYNAAPYLRDCIDSVLSQDYPLLEYIIIDGGSTDDTQAIVQSYGSQVSHFVSEPDQGLYDAMNKGLALASGEVIGMLNADDFYTGPTVISQVAQALRASGAETLFGDLVYVPEEDPDKIVRYFPGRDFHPRQMRRGLMPPHPTFFVQKQLYEAHGGFNTSYRICADFDLMLRLFLLHQVSYHYLPQVMVKMRTGGSSTQGIKSTLQINEEMLQSCRSHGIRTNRIRIYAKYFRKIFQLVRKPPKLAVPTQTTVAP